MKKEPVKEKKEDELNFRAPRGAVQGPSLLPFSVIKEPQTGTLTKQLGEEKLRLRSRPSLINRALR